jgi:hypothetical protein
VQSPDNPVGGMSMSDELHASSVADTAYAWGGRSDPGTETHIVYHLNCVIWRHSATHSFPCAHDSEYHSLSPVTPFHHTLPSYNY